MNKNPPELTSMSRCNKCLDFKPLTAWPSALPAVAVNRHVLAGFNQDLVFNHDLVANDDIATLFRSLYFELSLPELARLWQLSQHADCNWFPIQEVLSKFNLNYCENLENIFHAILKLPVNVQNYCSEKKWGAQDFNPLLIAENLNLNPFWLDCLNKKLSKSQAVLALELFVDLLKLGSTVENLLPSSNDTADLWIEKLKQKRYPETYKRDQQAQENLAKLPLPRTSQARWVRHGDKSGLELKMFLSHPSDVKKQIESLKTLQEAIEKSPEAFWTKH